MRNSKILRKIVAVANKPCKSNAFAFRKQRVSEMHFQQSAGDLNFKTSTHMEAPH